MKAYQLQVVFKTPRNLDYIMRLATKLVQDGLTTKISCYDGTIVQTETIGLYVWLEDDDAYAKLVKELFAMFPEYNTL